MQAILSILIVCVLVNVNELYAATCDLTERADDELAVLARKSERAHQIEILSILGERYRRPGEFVIHSKAPFQEAQPTSMGVSSLIITNVFEIAKSDQNTAVRVAALDVLKVLLNRTNILVLFEGFLGDPELSIRLRSCGAMIRYAKDRGMPVSEKVCDSLAHSLDPSSDSASLCVALQCVRELGHGASTFEPSVVRLTKHRAKEVRNGAKAALRAIQAKSP